MKDAMRLVTLASETARASRSLIGERIAAVTYFHPDPGWPDDYLLSGEVHEPDFAVDLRMASGAEFLICWEMMGRFEALSIRSGDAAKCERARWVAAPASDVSSVEPWPDLVGVPVRAVRTIGGCLIPKGLQVGLDSGRVLQIVLGEWGESELHYVPNALTVLFGDERRI